jgi:hypothetical protein
LTVRISGTTLKPMGLTEKPGTAIVCRFKETGYGSLHSTSRYVTTITEKYITGITIPYWPGYI